MVQKLKESGKKLGSVLAVCDVSGSMIGLPMQVSVSLGLLTATLAEEPFHNLVCTFSDEPELFRIPEGDLKEKMNHIERMKYGLSTNFEAVLDLILQRAIKFQVPSEKLMKRIIVFTDMQFNCCSQGNSSTHEKSKREFEKHGYEIPQIVYWNLSTYSSAPATKNDDNVLFISGFSGNLLRLLMDGEEDLMSAMADEKAVKETKCENNEVIDKVKVVDTEKSIELLYKAISDPVFEKVVIVD
jgi:hypothetical protein